MLSKNFRAALENFLAFYSTEKLFRRQQNYARPLQNPIITRCIFNSESFFGGFVKTFVIITREGFETVLHDAK